MQNELFQQAKQAAQELVAAANLKKGDILVVGCSSSEVAGGVIGHNSSLETAEAVFGGIYEVLQEKGIYLAAQCCEHLNRAICVERAAVPNAEEVCVVPQPKAGGSFATTAYRTFDDPDRHAPQARRRAGAPEPRPHRQRHSARGKNQTEIHRRRTSEVRLTVRF